MITLKDFRSKVSQNGVKDFFSRVTRKLKNIELKIVFIKIY